MAIRPFAFGVRLRDPALQRTLRITRDAQTGSRYVIEDERPEATTRRACASAAEAVEEGARIWRHRLN
jgi:hypothetical protein